jgi:hypothetical protein
MATTTPNYGWSVPESTDLVKDGATAIELLGDSIDSTTKDLNPSTTEGDIEYRSATADTNSRLAIGTAGQVLTVNSGAVAPEWATLPAGGGMTLISTTALTGSSVTTGTIPGTYKHLYVVINDLYLATQNDVSIRFNSDTGTNYSRSHIRNLNTTVTGLAAVGQTSIFLSTRNTPNNTLNQKTQILIEIPRYTDTVPKGVHAWAYMHDGTNAASQDTHGSYVGTSAISSITIIGASNFSDGNLYVYGVN